MVQIPLESYAIPYMLARNANSGTILLYVREDIPSTLLIFDLSIERFFVEINLMKTKFFSSSYNPKKSLGVYHLNCISRGLDLQLRQYKNFFLMDDFNVESIDYAAKKNYC